MRILLVEPDFDDNGAVRVSLDRARRWQAMGADVSVLFVSGHNEGARVVVPTGLRTIIANRRVLSARWMLPKSLARGLLEARKADVIVAGREIASGLLIGALLAKLARRPLAVTIHSNVEAALKQHATPRHRRNVFACLRSAGAVMPVAKGLVSGLLEIGIQASRVQVVENGFEADKLRVDAQGFLTVVLPSGPFIVGLGRLSKQKGFDVLIRAHALALSQGAPPHQVVLAGEGPEREALSALAAELGVLNSVTFAGFVENPYALLAKASLFVLPSRWEGFPLALSEAVLLKVPVVAADCVSGPGEILDAGRYGDLVRVDHEQGLADAITQHFQNPERLTAMAAEGSSFIEQRYSAARAARDHLEALRILAFAKALSSPYASALGVTPAGAPTVRCNTKTKKTDKVISSPPSSATDIAA